MLGYFCIHFVTKKVRCKSGIIYRNMQNEDERNLSIKVNLLNFYSQPLNLCRHQHPAVCILFPANTPAMSRVLFLIFWIIINNLQLSQRRGHKHWFHLVSELFLFALVFLFGGTQRKFTEHPFLMLR